MTGARTHAFPGSILMGAESRLLPYDIPLRFFVAAAVFQVIVWGLLAIGHADVSGFVGGPGLVLAALHALTLGVLAMTAMGASLQLLGVATGVALTSLLPCRLASWLFIPGTVALVGGMAMGAVEVMAVGGGLVAGGLVLFAVVVAGIFRRAPGVRLTVRHGWGALVALALLVIAGLALIVDFQTGGLGRDGLPGHGETALAHAVLGIFGFMGLLVLGFSYVLVPMFALAAAPDARAAGLSLGLAGLGLVVGVAGALSGEAGLLLAGAGVGLGGVAVHLGLMVQALRRGMKKRLGLSFVLVRAAWGLLPVALVLGGWAAAGAPDPVALLFGFVATFGWLLTFLGGVLQRILPFLASMHAHKQGRRAPRLTAMGHQRVTLTTHAAGHAVAITLVAAGIAVDMPALVLAGAGAGVVGALAFLWFTLGVARHLVAFHRAPPTELE